MTKRIRIILLFAAISLAALPVLATHFSQRDEERFDQTLVQAVRMVKRVRGWCPDLTIVARARDAEHAAELYKAGATDAVPETLESSLQLSEAVLVDLGMAMGPVIASIHEKRAELRQQIMEMGEMEREPPQRGKRLRDALMR